MVIGQPLSDMMVLLWNLVGVSAAIVLTTGFAYNSLGRTLQKHSSHAQ
jgi:hypothetical protein